MNISVDSAYGNFNISVSVEAEAGVDGNTHPTLVKLARLGLASEIYRSGNSAVDKWFAPKKEGKGGKMVAVLEGFKRESVAYSEENAKGVKAALHGALSEDYTLEQITVTEKVKGEGQQERKRATEMYEKAEAAGTLGALWMLLQLEGEPDRETTITALHGFLNPAKK